ncbi:hypothetical protein [Microcoleus sp. LEGE 07076]|nr:hypothetical protein [Microcoleus sp. LEGE 07076]
MLATNRFPNSYKILRFFPRKTARSPVAIGWGNIAPDFVAQA